MALLLDTFLASVRLVYGVARITSFVRILKGIGLMWYKVGKKKAE
ncbi:MAG: hypothetical protein ACE364_10030 [Chlorobiota bacterium]